MQLLLFVDYLATSKLCVYQRIESNAMTNQQARTPTKRGIRQISKGQPATDGDGVRLTRIIGTSELNMLDPFLLLDTFESDVPQDYIGGFPSHPHRGFETVTYLLAGQMRHKDSAGNEGLIEPGGVQWMSAAKGIVHSEMPEQIDGLLKGFQLWVNLPAVAKMGEPNYQEFAADKVEVERWQSGSQIRVVAGTTNNGTTGPVQNAFTDPIYMDVQLSAKDEFNQNINERYNGFIYVIEGSLTFAERTITEGNLVVLSPGEILTIENQSSLQTRFLLIAGKPLGEPVARGGPFVMNTKAEVYQAFEDFQNNQF